MSLKSQLLEQLKRSYPKWLNGGEGERFALDNGFKASNAGRRLRELAKAGTIERRINEGGSVEYQYRPLPDEVIKKPKPIKLFEIKRKIYDPLWK